VPAQAKRVVLVKDDTSQAAARGAKVAAATSAVAFLALIAAVVFYGIPGG
jgi:hypothetical protein